MAIFRHVHYSLALALFRWNSTRAGWCYSPECLVPSGVFPPYSSVQRVACCVWLCCKHCECAPRRNVFNTIFDCTTFNTIGISQDPTIFQLRGCLRQPKSFSLKFLAAGQPMKVSGANVWSLHWSQSVTIQDFDCFMIVHPFKVMPTIIEGSVGVKFWSVVLG